MSENVKTNLSAAGTDHGDHHAAFPFGMSDLQGYEFIVDNSHDLISYIDRDYRYLLVNQAYVRTYGRHREEIIGKTVAEVWGESIFDAVIRPRFDQCFAGTIVKDQAWIHCGELGQRFMDIAYHPFPGHGTVKAAVVISHDITDMKRAENELRDREERYRLLFENSMDLIMSVNREGTITFLNPMAAKVFAPGSNFLFQVEHEDLEITRKMFDDIRLGHSIKGVEVRAQGINKRTYVLSIMATPARDMNQEVLGCSIIARDISHQRRSEMITRDAGLTTRETQILNLVVQGYTNLNIAKRLNIQESTIKFHMNRIFKKTNTQSRTELVALVYENQDPAPVGD